MPAAPSPSAQENNSPDQGFKPLAEILSGLPLHSYVKQTVAFSEVQHALPRAPQRRGGGKERAEAETGKHRKPKNRGGWQTTGYIDHKLWKQTRHNLFELSRAGYQPTIFITVRSPLGIDEGEAKKTIERKFSRLGEMCERAGHPYVALKVYEKKRGGLLHGHALIYVSRQQFYLVERWADFFETDLKRSRTVKNEEPNVDIHARRAVDSDGFYILKQHKFAGPGGKEKQLRGPWWEPSEPIKGQRVSWTKTARAILNKAPVQAEKTKAIHREAKTADEPVAVPIQLVLPLDLAPVSPILKLVEEKRVELHLTQREAAERLGIKQSAYSNGVCRQHDRLSSWVLIRAREFVAERIAA